MRAQCTFHRPDAEKLTAALNRYYFDPVGIVLCLAWRAGLGRGEIHALTWEQVDFRGEVLRLPDREVPLSPELREALLRWEKRCAALEDRHVAVSPRLKTHLQPASISILARSALDSVGLEDVTLKDLRYDCICRMLETHDWPYVLRVTGISLETYRTWFAPLFQSAAPERGASAPEPAPVRVGGGAGEQEYSANEYRLWLIMQKERATPAGIALWLMQQLGLHTEQILRLTWDDIDFKRNRLRLGGKGETRELTKGVARVLREELDRRAPGEDPHVILSARARRPIDPARFSVMLRTTLIRGGIDDLNPIDVRRGAVRETENRLIANYVRERGVITTRECAELLDTTENRARARLKLLADSGALVCVGIRYYPAGQTVGPEKHREIILGYLNEHGSIRCQDAARLLNLPARQAGLVLRRMAERGFIVRKGDSRRYLLRDA